MGSWTWGEFLSILTCSVYFPEDVLYVRGLENVIFGTYEMAGSRFSGVFHCMERRASLTSNFDGKPNWLAIW